jgi:hypothetical protein
MFPAALHGKTPADRNAYWGLNMTDGAMLAHFAFFEQTGIRP